MILAHKIQLDPTKKQEVCFSKACGVARFTWNWALAKWNELYEIGHQTNAQKLKKEFNRIKRTEFPWIYDSPKDANQQVFVNIQDAWTKYFKSKQKNKGKPKFKIKGIKDSFYISNDKFSIKDKIASLPKIGDVRLLEKLRFQGKIQSATISKRADKWFISIQVDVENYSKNRISSDIVGVDLGIKKAATLSNGESFDSPKPLKKNIRKLKKLSRSLSRKKKGSKNRYKAKKKLSKLHYKISNTRKDFLHKLTTKLNRENQTIVIEDLNVSGMVKNRKLSRAISDIGFFEFRRQLTYKAVVYKTNIVIVDRFFPSSKLCSGCGHKKEKLSLSIRTYVCSNCNLVLDRDLNAALNLRNTVGYTGIKACGPTNHLEIKAI
jgi:putative transposase